ncbi:MAG: LON peptidase substrate-binding domain-containing protein [Deltaproteobacteria bacterium]|nr:LON peptidase substrate-binding domain-containing protein [Deltaproteobacteria bacterium]MBP7286979.1 LON peptidase substrate-binding domain-containing protein [Nannocystaceae bacterium]
MLDDVELAEDVLTALPIFPLPNVVLLPGIVLPLNVFEPRYVDLVDHVIAHHRHVGVPLLRPGFERNYEGRCEVEPVFGIGRLLSHQRLPDGRRFIRLEGVRRVRALEELSCVTRFRQLQVELLPEESPDDDDRVEVLKAQLERISKSLPTDDQQLLNSVLMIPDARVLLYAIAAVMPTFGCMPTNVDGRARSPVLEVQQRCLDAETADLRAQWLLECSQNICNELHDSGRYPRSMLN